MKKMIAFMLACCLAFGATACSNTNTNKPEPAKQEETQDNTDSTNETSKESNTNSANNTLLGDEYYNYGIKALESVDQYLDAEIEKEETISTLVGLKERVGENDDYGIETLWSILSLLESSLEKDSPDFNINDVKQYRDDLAGLLKSSLRYRDTTKKTFDITSEKFLKAMNIALESIDNSLLLDDFTRIETDTEKYFDVAYYSIVKNGITVEYSVDKKTDKLTTLRIATELDNPSENDLYNLVYYCGIAIGILNYDSDSDNDIIAKELKLDDFSNGSSGDYKSNNAEYTKYIFNNNYTFYVRP